MKQTKEINFGGIQKLTLLDFPGHTACTLFTQGCNYRCPFCHNAGLVEGKERVIPAGEILEFLAKRKGLLDGVCLTGGEPLIHPELHDFIREVKAQGFLVKLDTNGSFPDVLERLVHENLLDYVAMDLKNTPEKYPQTTGMKKEDLEPIEESIHFLLRGEVPYEFRTTVVREFHTKEDLVKMAHWIADADKYFLQAFVDSGNLIQPGLSGYAENELKELLAAVQTVLPQTQLRGV
ncbi:anaerobic ribonucleoside-triphosphate reductase activating protein [Enterococcus hirae]|nr:anaerobic ribonucleoside-triphosphate reductase activating protein [Enterococcus hirae]